MTDLRDGNFRRRLLPAGDGVTARLAEVFNEIAERNQHLAGELLRVRQAVGEHGRLDARLDPGAAGGGWSTAVAAANGLVDDLVRPTVELNRVLVAAAEGDLSQRIPTRRGGGEIAELGITVNRLLEQLSVFASEVTRVAREVGTDGKLGGQADVPGAAGMWRDLTDSVNVMASNLTGQVRSISTVASAVANGDLSQQIRVNASGEVAALADTINSMTGTLRTFAGEVTRVAREIGSDGRLGGQADVPGVAGTWKDLTDNVNFMAGALTAQVRDIATVASAVANGDLSRKINVDARGEILEVKNTINTMVDQLSAFASEVTRVAREVGTEGKLGGQATVPGIAGTWKDLTDNVNFMAGNLTTQVRNIASVATAVAKGDLSQKIDVDAQGEILELKNTLNTMVDQLSAFASEVTRVAREVGSEGRLGGQAQVPGVAGTWKDLTDNVNFMAGNLTSQVRNIAQVTTAVARGDLSQKIDVDARGEILELKNTLNTMVDQLSAFADEVTRVAREVGTEGILGGQARVPGVAGTWRDLTDSVNFMAGNLTSQVRNIASVATAVAKGDLSQKIDVDARGEILELKNTLNTMVDQLSAFADEVTRVAREVGSDGRLGGQATVPGVAGTWRDLTDSVNFMAGNLTSQVRNIAQVTTAVARGDLTQKINVDARGEILELKNTINTMVDQLSAFADEVTRVAREVGTDGKLGGQAQVRGVAGTWKDLTDNVNVMAENLTNQVRSIATVAASVAGGDLSKKIVVDASGEVAALAETLNGMVDTLRAFANEVTRVAREVGTEGKLGGQARVPGVAGTWKDLTDNVNFMAQNLTSQVRNIALVTTAVAQGDLSKKIDVDAQGEILELKTTINTMVDQLSAFASEVTRVAREVGTEGILGGQAEVIGVSGTWQRLTENVNNLAGNLTTQIRAIAAVATAVTAGDLTRQIDVAASGEVAELNENINLMIANLEETTKANQEQDWLKTNLARISGLMQGHRDLGAVASLIMSELTPLVSAQRGAFFLARTSASGRTTLELTASYGGQGAVDPNKTVTSVALGETLIGQAAKDKKTILVTDVPPGYARISSGLGSATPTNVIVLPLLFESQTLGVLELASLGEFTPVHLDLLEQLKETIAVNVNTILANSRTEEARQELEDRARQLATASKYKSEFMANMSHELRTPLNSALILAKLLADNLEGNLTPKQTEFAKTIYSAGSDLLQLIDDILDLSKVEAGKMEAERTTVQLRELLGYVESLCRPLTVEKGLEFSVVVAPSVPETLLSDEHRLQQILRNLLSNAVKFTHTGGVELRIRHAEPAEVSTPELRTAPGLLAFVVSDTGIGIPPEKLAVIFEAFRQADGTTSRKYGGTGLGLSITRELTQLLGGELQVHSEPGRGSSFTLYLPLDSAVPDPNGVPTIAPVETPAELPPAPRPQPMVIEPAALASMQTSARFHGEKVLIVDDDLRNVFALSAVLEMHGLHVVFADNGVAGVRALEQYDDIALVLMDVMMPELDGNATIGAIREMASHEDLPIIAVTAKAMPEDRKRTLAAGATDYVTKPVDTELLLQLIATHLEPENAQSP
ncbi:HAMP domain-containing protein [Allokutzneria albata]|nr:HAMP domain-containing protein [Allokutzneria albata]